MVTRLQCSACAEKDHYKEQNFVLDAMRLKCSADRLGVELPFHIIYGGGLTEPRFSEGFPSKFGVIRIALGLVFRDI